VEKPAKNSNDSNNKVEKGRKKKIKKINMNNSIKRKENNKDIIQNQFVIHLMGYFYR